MKQSDYCLLSTDKRGSKQVHADLCHFVSAMPESGESCRSAAYASVEYNSIVHSEYSTWWTKCLQTVGEIAWVIGGSGFLYIEAW